MLSLIFFESRRWQRRLCTSICISNDASDEAQVPKKKSQKRRRLLVKKMLKVEELNPENVWLKCHLIQRQTGCSHKAIKSMINSVCGKIPRATVVKMDKKLKDGGGGMCLQLNGCVNCNRHVFLPYSKETCCPKCGGARFDKKKAKRRK